MTVNPLSLQERIPVSSVTEENLQTLSNKTCDGPSFRAKPLRSVSCIERYALALAEGLEAPPLLVNPCVTIEQLQAAAEADIARLKKTIESDSRALPSVWYDAAAFACLMIGIVSHFVT